ncbi:transglycosylase domain-containing protein [Phenylobacterium sp.]|uniref:transglycosylase domain-containing protein n=1 Tax=Phenylobacterium sp. TaxID=1871053 RepID=UPI0035B14875
MPPNSFARRTKPPEPPRRRLRLWPMLGALLCVALVGAAGFGLAVQRFYVAGLPQIPDRATLWSAGRPPGVTFIGPDGQVLAYRGPRHGRRVELADLPARVPQAFLAAEDKRFYQHGPIDLRGLLRAAAVNLRAGRPVEGASTLSQQLARTLFLKPDKTIKRKIQEAFLAARLEQALSKDEILQLYLNRIYFGDRAYGLAAAADGYFGKDPRDLTLGEAALLAALPKAPTRLSLTKDLPAAWSRARLILTTMAEMNWITPDEARAALAAAPKVRAPAPSSEGDMAWALDAAQKEAEGLVGPGAAPDLVVRLTVDPALQAAAAQALRRNLGAAGRQGALVALAPDGAIRAMIGGVDHGKSPYDRALQARRQPGSSFKPFVWAAALEQGVGPFDVRMDEPIAINGWTPQNYGGGYHGPVTVERALQLSLNTVSVRLAREAGVDHVASLARRFGLSTIPEHPGPSLALGAYEVSLLQLVSAYQVLQNAGSRVQPYLVAEVTNARGDVLYRRAPSAGAPVYSQYQAGQMVRMMQGVITAGTGRRADIGRPAAGKTGTSQDYRDAWFVGFTPDWACGVWVGHDDNRPMRGVTGGSTPATIWRAFMTVAEKGLPVRDFDWAPELTPPPSWFDDQYAEDPYAEDPGETGDDGRWPDGAPWESPQGPGSVTYAEPRGRAVGPLFPPGYGRARAPADIRPPTPRDDADLAEERAGSESGGRPTWSPSTPF